MLSVFPQIEALFGTGRSHGELKSEVNGTVAAPWRGGPHQIIKAGLSDGIQFASDGPGLVAESSDQDRENAVDGTLSGSLFRSLFHVFRGLIRGLLDGFLRDSLSTFANKFSEYG